MVPEFQSDNGKSNGQGEKSDGIPKDIQGSGGSNRGKSIRDWRAGRGAA